MPHLSKLLGGKAAKRSRFGSVWRSHQIGTRRSAEACQRAHLKYHSLDSEWIWHYLAPEEAKDLAVSYPGVTTILSFSSRHHGALKILRKTLETGISERIALSLIAGNRAYLTRNEAKRSPGKALTEAVKFARRYFQGEIFVGTEGMWKVSARLAAEYDLIPYLLLGKDLKESVAHFKDATGGGAVALYVPFLVSENYPRLLDDVLQKLGGYIFRREWVQKGLRETGVNPTHPDIQAIIKDKQKVTAKFLESRHGDFLRSAASTLAIYGTKETVTERIRAINRTGVNIVIGYPVKESVDQTLAFGECVRRASED